LIARPIVFALVVLALGSLRSTTANAEPSTSEKALASRLFDDASKLLAAGQAPAACAKYAESQRLDPELGTLLHLAECYAKVGKTASAWTTFREAADVATQRSDPRSAKIRERIASIEKNLSELILVVAESEPKTLEIRQDGALLGRAGWGTPVPVDPGEHTITATAPGTRPRELKVTVMSDGQTLSVRLPAAEAAPAAGPAPSPPKVAGTPVPTRVASGSEGRRTVAKPRALTAMLIGGAGVVGLGVGAVFGLMVKPAYDDSAAHCNGNYCDATGHDARQNAFAKARISNIAFAAGASALAVGAVIWLTAPKTHGDERRGSIALRPLISANQASLTAVRSW